MIKEWNTLKILKESTFIIGKIKIWNNPQFVIEKFGPNADKIKNILEKELDCSTDLPYYKKPHINTILGKFHPTFRFEFIKMDENSFEEVIEHVNFGFGQNGYYYDIHIKTDECNKEKWGIICEKVINFSKIIEKTAERKFIEFSYNDNLHNTENWEISNFDLTFEDANGFINKKFPEFKPLIQRILGNQERISLGYENIIFPELYLNIDSIFHIDNPILYKRSEKFLERDRRLAIRLIPPNDNIWNISSRGIPFEILFRYIESLF